MSTIKRQYFFLCILFLFGLFKPKALFAQAENSIIIEWNELAYQIANEHDQFYSFIGIRSLTMMHLAIHDVLNAVEPKYKYYAYDSPSPKAAPRAAIAQAAFEILLQAYPERRDTITFQLEKCLNKVAKGRSKQAGLDLGKAAAKKIIALREGDGHKKQGNYTPMTKPGDYQYTPGWDNWVLKPDFDYARPFCMDSVTQFRSPKPPALNSASYTQSYREVKAYGAKESTLRSEDQTHYAHWWAEFAEHSWNRIARILAQEKALGLWETARLFALINMDIYDIYLASLESKYFYDTWRPYTAIRAADTDENRHTIGDQKWEPQMQTPPWPEYPSAHAAVGSGGAAIVSHVFGTSQLSFTMESTSAKGKRTYHNLNDAAEDCADSRILNGYHFRFATEEGKEQGKKIAAFIYSNFLVPLTKLD